MTLTRRTPMARGTGFGRTPYVPRQARQWTADELPGPRVPLPALELRIPDGKAGMAVTLPKEKPYRSEAYRRLVAALPCAHCKRPGPSQCAHGDAGKGMGIKASDLTCFPLCADSPGRRGCHSMIGASGTFTREQRRTLEEAYAASTRQELKATA